MFHSLSQHHFDTMFVILCVIAGANSHSFSNSSRSTPTHLLNRRHAHSFIDLIIDASLGKLSRNANLKSNRSYKSYDDSERSHSLDLLTSNDNYIKLPATICARLSNVLTGSQMKFCMQHQGVLELVVPEIFKLAREECIKITSDLRWNCSTIRPFLDKSSLLAFTREAALIRSLLNASMMYLILKLCTDHGHYSCGCASHSGLTSSYGSIVRQQTRSDFNNSEISSLIADQLRFNHNEISTLDTGSPIRLSMLKRQGCRLNMAFAASLTAALFDAEDSKSISKSTRILNEAYSSVGAKKRQMPDVDRRDLAFIKWVKSAVNLHNNNVGRQVVRVAVRERCRCHGISGACSLQTCWDEVNSFSQVAKDIRAIYLDRSNLVVDKNIGSVERPDIYLARVPPGNNRSPGNFESSRINHFEPLRDQIRSKELAYLYESPEYCIEQEMIKHRGTRGRQCSLQSATARNDLNITRPGTLSTGTNQPHQGPPGSCEHLCCGRGYKSELVLHLVSCECRFKFCCKVVCSECPKQQLQHYCS